MPSKHENYYRHSQCSIDISLLATCHDRFLFWQQLQCCLCFILFQWIWHTFCMDQINLVFSDVGVFWTHLFIAYQSPEEAYRLCDPFDNFHCSLRGCNVKHLLSSLSKSWSSFNHNGSSFKHNWPWSSFKRNSSFLKRNSSSLNHKLSCTICSWWVWSLLSSLFFLLIHGNVSASWYRFLQSILHLAWVVLGTSIDVSDYASDSEAETIIGTFLFVFFRVVTVIILLTALAGLINDIFVAIRVSCQRW